MDDGLNHPAGTHLLVNQHLENAQQPSSHTTPESTPLPTSNRKGPQHHTRHHTTLHHCNDTDTTYARFRFILCLHAFAFLLLLCISSARFSSLHIKSNITIAKHNAVHTHSSDRIGSDRIEQRRFSGIGKQHQASRLAQDHHPKLGFGKGVWAWSPGKGRTELDRKGKENDVGWKSFQTLGLGRGDLNCVCGIRLTGWGWREGEEVDGWVGRQLEGSAEGQGHDFRLSGHREPSSVIKAHGRNRRDWG